MSDRGPHSHVCADAEGGVCHCDCRGAMHGVRHLGGKLSRLADVSVSRLHKKGGGVRVIDSSTGLPPGGGTAKERRLLGRMADVSTTRQGETEDDGQTRHSVSTGLRARIDEARQSLPSSEADWMRPVDRDARQAAEIRERIAADQKRLAELEAEREGLAASDEVFGTRNARGLDAEIDALRDSIARKEQYAEGYENPAYRSFEYPVGRSGELAAPRQWRRHLETVIDVGRETLNEHRRMVDGDAEYKRLKADSDAAKQRRMVAQSRAFDFTIAPSERRQATDDWDAARKDYAKAESAALARDQEILRSVLTSARRFGGVHHAPEFLTAEEGSAGGLGSLRGPARSDHRELFRDAEGFFPATWLQMSKDKGPLRAGTSARAFYQHDQSTGGGYVSSPAEGRFESYIGGHGAGDRAGALDVTVHELGHRMEMSVPGLTQLEMTFVRQRSTDENGNLEQARQMAGYEAGEIAYHDRWANAYTGKTYEGTSANPGGRPWEVFQVGLQDLYSRKNEFDHGDELQSFVIGALLTLG